MVGNSDEELPSLARHDVFILGAGFSKAINEEMPVAAELLEPVLRKLEREYIERPRGNEGLEQWMSRLAGPQPYLSADQTLERSATYLKVSRAVARVITEREQQALAPLATGAALPDWFAQLLFAWHLRQATVISFNYDNLVECGVNSQHLPRPYLDPVSVNDVLCRLPPLPSSRQSEDSSSSTIARHTAGSGAGYWSENREQWEHTFRLLKLHGSVSWYWVPDDATGATMQRWPDVGRFGLPPSNQLPRIAAELPGREVFIAPPSSAKSRYLSNPIIRQLWSVALTQLTRADRVFILGYSMPTEDQAAMGLLLEGLAEHPVKIHIVDKCPDPVGTRLVNLVEQRHWPWNVDKDRLHPNCEPTIISDGHEISSFAKRYFNELVKDGTHNLVKFARELAPIDSKCLEAAWNGPEDSAHCPIAGPVLSCDMPRRAQTPDYDYDNIEITDGMLSIKEKLDGDVDSRELTKLMKRLQDCSDSGELSSMRMCLNDGTELPVIPWALERAPSFGDNGYCLVLAAFAMQLPSMRVDYSDPIKGA